MLFPGVCEEAFVRGYVQRRLLLRWPPLAAILYSSVIFAAWHLQPANVLAVLPGGLWLGYVAWRADSIRPTVAAHAVWGGALYVVRTSETLVSAAEHAAFTPTLSVLGLACAALTVLALERSARRDPRPGPTPGTPPAPPPPPPGPGGR